MSRNSINGVNRSWVAELEESRSAICSESSQILHFIYGNLLEIKSPVLCLPPDNIVTDISC